MTITYPVSFPTPVRAVTSKQNTTIRPAKTTFRMIDKSAISRSPFTGSQQIYLHQGAWWEVDVALPAMKRIEAEQFIAFLASLRGMYGTFLLGDYDGRTARGIATGTPLVNGASQTGYTLITDGWTISQTGIMKNGDYFQLGSGSSTRLHKITADVNSNGSGQATLDIWPALRSSPADNAALTVSSAMGLFRLASPNRGWDADEAAKYGIQFSAIEAL